MPRAGAAPGDAATPPASPLGAALVLLGAVAAVLVVIELGLFAAKPPPVWPLVLFVLVGAEYVVAGLLAWARRPANGTGALLCLCGLSLLVAALSNAAVPALFVVGNLVAELPIGVLLHLLLAYPSGRLPDRWSRGLVAAGYVLTGVLHLPKYVFSGATGLPPALAPAGAPDVAAAVQLLQSAGSAVVFALTLGVLWHRLRGRGAHARRVLGAVYGYGAMTILVLVVSVNVLAPVFDLGPIGVFVVQIVAFAGVPIAFATAVLAGGFARTRELDGLVRWLATAPEVRPALRDALRDTLGDPSLDVLYWLPDREHFVDDAGEVASAVERPGRGLVEVGTPSGRVGAICYDATLLPDPRQVVAAGRIVALALERERLTAELRASREELRDSRRRIVQSGDEERRRIARDLHDGLQGRLVVLALRAGRLAVREDVDPSTATEAAALRTELEQAITELRELVQGVLPALLVQRGLYAGVEELLDRSPVQSRLTVTGTGDRLPGFVETAGYFVVAEAVTNAVKHAGAARVTVSLDRDDGLLRIEVCDDGTGGASPEQGTGLRGIADRVEALGGRMWLDSPPHRGTRVHAELPCAS